MDIYNPATFDDNSSVEKNKILSQTFAAKINGTHVDFFIGSYSNRYFIIITQFQKLGTLVSVEKDFARSEGESKSNVIYSTRILLGRDDDQVNVAARFLAEQLKLDKPVIFSIGLQDLSVSVLRAVCQLLAGKL